MANINRDVPLDTISEGGAKGAKNGRPRKRLPMSSILKVLKGIEDQAMEGRSPDPSYSRKILADYACINLERAFTADDNEIPLKARADMALRIAPVVAMLETLIPKDANRGMPHTEAAVDVELQRRFTNLKKMVEKGADMEAEKILDTLAPQAQGPVESV